VDHAGGAPVGQQRGVGGEQAPPQLEVDVVVRVEPPRRAPRVHGRRRDVVGRGDARWTAPRPELRRVRRVQRRVAAAGGAEAGEARREGVAVGHADGVRACMREGTRLIKLFVLDCTSR